MVRDGQNLEPRRPRGSRSSTKINGGLDDWGGNTIYVARDGVEAPHMLTLTFGGSAQERRGREHNLVEGGA